MNKGVIFFFSVIIMAAGIIALYQVLRRPSLPAPEPASQAQHLYQKNCARCHGNSGQGFAMNPSLQNTKLSLEQISGIIKKGSGEMPPFTKLTDQELRLLANFVLEM